MSSYKVVLLDVDGVLIIPPRPFSQIYCEKYGVDLEMLSQFYKTQEFKDTSIGKLDLAEAIRIHNDKWQWPGEPADLIQEWLEAENYPNDELIAIAKKLRQAGTKVYIVTQQEQHRAAFLRDKVPRGMYDDFLVSCDMGLHKKTPEFWQEIIRLVGERVPGITPQEIIYFDDKPNLVELALQVGIEAHVYTDIDVVKSQLDV